MLSVDQVYEIRRKVLVDGVGIRRVARTFGVSRNTVRKYLSEAEPRRPPRRPRRRPVREVVEARLEALIEEWTPRTAGKQRLTAARLHEELRHEGFTVGRTLVQELLRERRRRAAEVYVPLVHRPGDEAQIDFFDVRVDIGAERRRAWLFVLRLMYCKRATKDVRRSARRLSKGRAGGSVAEVFRRQRRAAVRRGAASTRAE